MTTTRVKNYLHGTTLFMLTLTGFAQMPIFKRYYIADIPGFGWLAEYYVTHLLHYGFASVFIAFLFYSIIMNRCAPDQKSSSGILNSINIFIATGLTITGFLMVLKNFPGRWFPDSLISLFDVAHVCFAMMMLAGLLVKLFRPDQKPDKRRTGNSTGHF